MICTVDVVLLTLELATLKVALVRREREPFAQALALPGGYIHAQDDVDAQASAERVLRGEAGPESPCLAQLATFTGAVRDPRGWSVAVAYCALQTGGAHRSAQLYRVRPAYRRTLSLSARGL